MSELESLSGNLATTEEEAGNDEECSDDYEADVTDDMGNEQGDKASLLDCSRTVKSKPDVISENVMVGSRGLPLYCIITITLCMTACSFLLLYQFDVHESNAFNSPHSMFPSDTFWPSMPKYDSHEFCNPSNPSESHLGIRIFEFQIHVLQNLVHASLVGSAAIVAVVRGDALWMYYVRNVAFFFMPVGFTFLFLDIRSIWTGESTLEDHAIRLVLAFCSAGAATIAFVIYTPVFFKIRQLLSDRYKQSFHIPAASIHYPAHLAETKFEHNLANLIYGCATVVQLLAWIYYGTTVTQWLLSMSSCSLTGSELERSSQYALMDLQHFEMAYSSGSHQALLIALFFLAATYPRDMASVGGALLTSMWRSLVAIGSLGHLILQSGTNVSFSSWLNTIVETAVMLPIFIASCLLAYNILHGQFKQKISRSLDGANKDGVVIEETSRMEVYQCASLYQISQSRRFTPEQRHGAWTLWSGTVLLLVEQSAECLIMLRQNQIGTDMTHEIYKW